MPYLFGSSLGYDDYKRSASLTDGEKSILILLEWFHGFIVFAVLLILLVNKLLKGRAWSLDFLYPNAAAAIGSFLLSIHPLLALIERDYSCSLGLYCLYIGFPLFALPTAFQAYDARARHSSLNLLPLGGTTSRDAMLHTLDNESNSINNKSSSASASASSPSTQKIFALRDHFVRLVIYFVILIPSLIAAVIQQYSRSFYRYPTYTYCWWTDSEMGVFQIMVLLLLCQILYQTIQMFKVAGTKRNANDEFSVFQRREFALLALLLFIWDILLLFYPGVWVLYIIFIFPILCTLLTCLAPLIYGIIVFTSPYYTNSIRDYNNMNPDFLLPSDSFEMQVHSSNSASSSKKHSIASNSSGNRKHSDTSRFAVDDDVENGLYVADDPNSEALRREQERLEQQELGVVNRIGKRLQKQLMVTEAGIALVIESGGVATLGRNSAKTPTASSSAVAIAAYALYKDPQKEKEKEEREREREKEREKAKSEEDIEIQEAEDSVPDELGSPKFSRPGSFLASRASLSKSSTSVAGSGVPPKGLKANLGRSASSVSTKSSRSDGTRSSLRLAEQVALEIELPDGPRPTTLKQVLMNPVYIELFKQFALGVYCSENILFYMEVAQFRTMMSKYIDALSSPNTHVGDAPSIGALLAKLTEIYDLFISEHALMQVNISFSARQPILKAVESQSPHISVFDLAQKEVLKLMNADTWPKFKQMVLSQPQLGPSS